MSEARVKVNFVRLTSGVVVASVSGLTDDERRKLRSVVDNRVRRFAETLNKGDSK